MRTLLLIYLLFCAAFSSKAQYQFIENKGQWNDEILFKAFVTSGEVFLERDGIRFFFYDGDKVDAFHRGQANDSLLDCQVTKLAFLGSQKPSTIEKSVEGSTVYNFFKGADKSKWQSDVKAFERIILKDVYPGIDFELYSFQYKIKYNFHVHAHADASDIKLKYLGAESVDLINGDIHISGGLRSLMEESPYSYQINDEGKEEEISTQFATEGDYLYFDLKETYRKDRLLIIDPTLIFATYSGSLADNFGFTATFDKLGNAYSGGAVYELGFPTTFGSFQRSWKGGEDVDLSVGDIERDIGILKYSPDGTKLLYATYLGGTQNEDPHSMVVNSNMELLVFGNTGSEDFPTNINAYDSSFNGGYDIFVSRFSTDGTRLLSSTFIGGSGKDGLNGQQVNITGGTANSSVLGKNYGDLYRGEIIVDEDDYVYFSSVSKSDDFPITSTTYQKTRNGKHDAVVVKLDPTLSQLLGCSYIGGDDHDAAYGIALDSRNNIFACGGTASKDMVFNTKAYQDTAQLGAIDGFIVKFSNGLDSLLAGTHFGSPMDEQCFFVQIDGNDDVYVTGQTTSDSFFLKDVKFRQPKGKQFISKLSNSLDTLIYSGLFGSGRKNPDLSPSAFLVDQCARLYFTGWGGPPNFTGNTKGLPIPDSAKALKPYSLNNDFYLAVFSENMDTILYATYYGGDTSSNHVDGGTSRYDRQGIVYQSVCAGCTGYSDFPATKGVVSETNKAQTGNSCNNALFKLDFDAPVLFADFTTPEAVCYTQGIKPVDLSINALEYFWDFGDGFTSKLVNPSHQYADSGKYTIRLIVANIFSCPGKDTFDQEIYLYRKSDASFVHQSDDCGWAYEFSTTSKRNETFSWQFGDGSYLFDRVAYHQYKDTGDYMVRLLTDSGTVCVDSSLQPIDVDREKPDFDYIVDSCETYVNFIDRSDNANNWRWEFEKGAISRDNNPGYYFKDTGSYEVVLWINRQKICVDSVKKTIHVSLVEKEADFSLELDSCNFSALAINKSIGEFGQKWVATNPTFGDSLALDFGSEGKYEIGLVLDPWSVCPDTVIQQINLPPIAESSFDLKVDSCLSKVETINLSQNAKSFRWSINKQSSTDKEPIFNLKDTGHFPIALIANPFSSCADTTLDTVSILLIKYAHFEVELIPCSKSMILKDKSLNAETVKWDYGVNEDSVEIRNDTIIYPSTGIYYLQLVIDADNPSCKDSSEQKLFIPEGPTAILTNEGSPCYNEVVLTNNGSFYTRFDWSLDGQSLATVDRLSHIFLDTNAHLVRLLVEDSLGCKDSSFLDFQMTDFVDPSIEVAWDTCTGQLYAEATLPNNATTSWYLDGQKKSSQSSVTLNEDFRTERNLKLIVFEGLPCEKIIELPVQFTSPSLSDLDIPNVISPNGSGENDEFVIDASFLKCENVELHIYDRWGLLVHHTTGEKLIWDAKNKNDNPLTTGVYFYVLKAGSKKISGTITVVI